MLFPYSKKPFDYEFVSDYLFVKTSNKSVATKSYYHTIVMAFVNKYNKEVHSYNSGTLIDRRGRWR